MIIKPKLKKAQFLQRYKRFLADVRMEDGQIITVHCPNTGSMRNCLVPESPCWISDSNNPARKYRYTWEIATTPGRGRAGINTHRANALVKEAIESGLVRELRGYPNIKTEVRYGRENSRIDLLLQNGSAPPCYVEVKSVTYAEADRCGYFPDAVSERASKHLRELLRIVKRGNRAVIFFCVQHSRIDRVRSADHIDPNYGNLLRQAMAGGVEVVAYRTKLSAGEIAIVDALPFLP